MAVPLTVDQLAENQRKIYLAILEAGRRMRPKEVSEATGIEKVTTRTAMRTMLGYGYLQQFERGYYYIVPLDEVEGESYDDDYNNLKDESITTGSVKPTISGVADRGYVAGSHSSPPTEPHIDMYLDPEVAAVLVGSSEYIVVSSGDLQALNDMKRQRKPFRARLTYEPVVPQEKEEPDPGRASG